MRSALVASVLVMLAACSGESTDDADQRSDPDDPGSACAEVRAGIDAFNLGDYDGTQIHFKRAVPLAADEREKSPGQRADDLLKAVSYYADLSPRAYPEAARSSPEFAKYKQITLTQCEAPVEEDGEDDGGDELTA